MKRLVAKVGGQYNKTCSKSMTDLNSQILFSKYLSKCTSEILKSTVMVSPTHLLP